MPGLFLFCRGSGIRTHDLVVPNDARYQAALYPEMAAKSTKTLRTFKVLLAFGQ